MTPSTSSTRGARTPGTPSSACAPPWRPAPRTSACATRTARRCRFRSPRRPPQWSMRWGTGWRSGSTPTTTAECGVANSLAAVDAGARLVQGTMNGYGERTGNANLVSILPALQLKMGYECVPDDRLRRLTETSHLVDELCNLQPDPDRPYVGRNAFAHKGGMHAAGVQADARTFEHIEPGLVGQQPRRPDLGARRQGLGAEPRRGRGHRPGRGRAPSGPSRGSRSASTAATSTRPPTRPSSCSCAGRPGSYLPLFRLEGFRVITEKRANGRVETEATIKIWVDGQRFVRTAEGNGPVNALDRALREAITELHPHLAQIELVNYKVRILDTHHGTGAVTRVLLDSADGSESWGTIGVSENIIEASWEALVDSLEYAFQPKERRRHRRKTPRYPRPLTAPSRSHSPDPTRAARGGAPARGAAHRPALAGPGARAVRAGLRRLARDGRRRRGLVRDGRAASRGEGAGAGGGATRW